MCNGSIIQTIHNVFQEFDHCIIIKNVSALVCSQCGEAYYSDEISDKLEGIMKRLQDIVKDIAIFEYDKTVKRLDKVI